MFGGSNEVSSSILRPFRSKTLCQRRTISRAPSWPKSFFKRKSTSETVTNDAARPIGGYRSGITAGRHRLKHRRAARRVAISYPGPYFRHHQLAPHQGAICGLGQSGKGNGRQEVRDVAYRKDRFLLLPLVLITTPGGKTAQKSIHRS